MKKVLALVLAIVLTCGVLMACGGSGESGEVTIPGTWNLSKAKADGTTVSAKDLPFTMSFIFNEDGTAAMIYEGETTDGLNWKQEGNVVKLSAYGIDLYDFQLKGSTLTLHEESENVDLIFSK